MQRRSGILLHPTSLPGPYPTGDFGEFAYRFVDWLHRAGQTLWQVLPLVPPDTNGSPYASHSAFGISSLLLDLRQMHDLHLLCNRDLSHTGDYPRADYRQAWRLKQNLVAHSYGHFITNQDARLEKEFKAFCVANAWWLDDHALFDALKKQHGGVSWVAWPDEFKRRDPTALAAARKDLRQDILNEQYAQWLAHRQWLKLKDYANTKGILVIGDVPFFVQHDSVDVWMHQDQFLLDRTGMPAIMAGAPPDMYSDVGQFWGNPIYDWPAMERTGYEWWRRRTQYYAALYDILRLDHFRGFHMLWHIPADSTDPRRGRWAPVPGRKLLTVISKELPATKLIAEDIGYITPDVVQLRDQFSIPGTRVMEFGFYGDNAGDPSLPHTYPEHCVAYASTHDAVPLKGWIEHAPADQRTRALRYTGSTPEKFSWALIEKGEHSKARWFISQLQDVLNLGEESRMNTPNTTAGNWQWRYDEKDLNNQRSARLKKVTESAQRV